MRITIYSILFITLICHQQNTLAQNNSSVSTYKIEIDTIVEKTDPKTLDFSKHQLFIDTTRKSTFYKVYTSWAKSTIGSDGVISSLFKEISKKYKPKQINLEHFPKKWITLRRFNNEFLIYKRCDGIDWRYEITKNRVILFGIWEPYVYIISDLNKLTTNSIQLELRTIQPYEPEQIKLEIKPTEFEYVYSLTYGTHKQFIIPIEKISESNMLINHCPIEKMDEFDGFD